MAEARVAGSLDKHTTKENCKNTSPNAVIHHQTFQRQANNEGEKKKKNDFVLRTIVLGPFRIPQRQRTAVSLVQKRTKNTFKAGTGATEAQPIRSRPRLGWTSHLFVGARYMIFTVTNTVVCVFVSDRRVFGLTSAVY